MNFQINRNLLLSNLNNVNLAVSNKPQLPILTGIKVEVSEDSINLVASNSDIAISSKILKSDQVKISEIGDIVVPGKLFYEIIKKCEGDNVTITTFETSGIKILCNNSTFTLNLFDSSLFPYLTFDSSKKPIILDSINLKQIIKKTAFATSDSETKMVLTGVNITVKDNKIEAIATDSYRLAKKYLEVSGLGDFDCNIIIPSKSLEILNKIIDDGQDDVAIKITKTKTLFTYKNIQFQTRLIDGTFPNTTSLIPTEFITSIKFNKSDILNAIERASLFSESETTSTIKFSMNEKGEIIITSPSSEKGEFREEIKAIECDRYLNFETAFSCKYFSEAVKSFDSDQFIIHFTGEIKPFVITSDYDVNHLQLILPIRL
ncbi:MAG: DNA polymerase III subunit beta [Bacilli bacterium]